jgi:hypothetical protein
MASSLYDKMGEHPANLRTETEIYNDTESNDTTRRTDGRNIGDKRRHILYSE